MSCTPFTIKARRYDTGEPVTIEIVEGHIERIVPAWPDTSADRWPLVAPAFFDLQINGHGGTWFSNDSLTADDVIGALEPHFAFGITRLCPTLITASFEALAAGFSAIDVACRRHDWVQAMVPGCHLEGPFISAEDGPRGAHPLEHVRAADYDEFCRLQEASGGRIRLVTLAAEAQGGLDFIRQVTRDGVVVAIGHTAAEPQQITAAVDAGARLSTHLGNGAHGTIRRHPNYIWEQLAEPRLWASIITDGHHLPESVIRAVIKTKSASRTIITCDAAGLAGCPPGIYEEGSMKVEILEDGRIVIAGQDQLLAGSSLQTDTCVAHAISAAGLSRQQAFDMAGLNPARLLGFETIELKPGSRADLVLFHHPGPTHPLDITATLLQGELKYGSLTN
jgi:N-acetylglucosamine-6-phosphate deacetylase